MTSSHVTPHAIPLKPTFSDIFFWETDWQNILADEKTKSLGFLTDHVSDPLPAGEERPTAAREERPIRLPLDFVEPINPSFPYV